MGGILSNSQKTKGTKYDNELRSFGKSPFGACGTLKTSKMGNIDQAIRAALEHHQAGRLPQAEAIYRQILQVAPNHYDALHFLGIIAYHEGRNEAAIELISKAICAKPSGLMLCNLGLAFHALGRFDEAVESYRRALSLESNDAEIHRNLGLAFHALGRFDEAIESYRRALLLEPNYAETHRNLGLAFHALGALDEAVESYRKALSLEPDDAETHYKMGFAFHAQGRLDEATENYLKALVLRPDHIQAHFNLGSILKIQGNLDNAIDHYHKVLSLDPSNAEAHYNLGNLLNEQDWLGAAAEHYRKALLIKPGYAEACHNLGGVLQKQGKLDEAIATFNRALLLKPDHASAYTSLGFALRDLDQFDAALDSFRRALDFMPNLPNALEGTFKVYLESNNYPQAVLLSKKIIADIAAASPSADILNEPPITALLPFGRSGSLFFHSLFDGHPQITTLPGVYFKGWFGHKVWERFAPSKENAHWRQKLVDSILTEFEPLFDARSTRNVIGKPFGPSNQLAKTSGFMEMGPDRDAFFSVGKAAFASALLALLQPLETVSQKDCFLLIHRAFDVAVGRGGNAEQIFYHIHNPDPYELACFIQRYHAARLLHIVRHPVQGMESWMIGDIFDAGEADLFMSRWLKAMERVEVMFYQLQSPFNVLAEARGVRLEDVKRDPHRTMPQVAAWMGIIDNPALYEASFCGLRYWGPASKATGKITGFDTRAIDQPVGRLLGERDVKIFEALFWPFSRLYGYTEMDETTFRSQLAEIRPWLDEPMQFEEHLYARLPEPRPALEELLPYRRLHRLLRNYWAILEREGTYPGMVEPLELRP